MSLWRYRPKPGEWSVWKRVDSSGDDESEEDSTKGGSRRVGPFLGCFSLLVIGGLLFRGLPAGIVALLGSQSLPISLLILGHVPLLVMLILRAGASLPDAPEDKTSTYFLGYLTEEGLRLDSGGRIPWQKILRYELGWASHAAIRVRLHLDGTKALPSIGSTLMAPLRMAIWVPAPTSVVVALLLAARLPGHDLALRASVCAAGIYLILAAWFVTIVFQVQRGPKPAQKPMELLFDAAQVSADEVMARLDRHVPPPSV
ncbi:MAG: hypothetical protein QM758_06885 [Armatimonas sp.]